jgi:glycosyltransferase involved in cell wall biosynthesis
VKPLRVLHVVANRWWTGTAEPALDLACRLRQRGHAVWFACIRGDALEAHVRATGLPLVEGVSLERTSRPWRLGADVARLARILGALAIDVVHAHQTHDHWLAALAARGGPSRLVRTVHHRRGIHGGLAGRWLLRRSGALVAVSEGIAARLRAIPGGRERVAVVPGAVDVQRFTPWADGRAVREELGLGEAPVVGCVARMVPGRGHEVLLRAAALLRERIPALRVVLVGRGEHVPALEAEVAALSLGRTVVFAGYRGEDLPSVLAALDCFVLLGGGSEESCRAVLEAMAVGRPVVAARVGALPETVVDGETGWLVTAEPRQVAERLERILADTALAARMGAAGRRRVEALFTPERRAAAVEAVYRRVLAGGAVASP